MVDAMENDAAWSPQLQTGVSYTGCKQDTLHADIAKLILQS
jgi:hypothetical protein